MYFQLTFLFTDGALGNAQESSTFTLTVNVQRNNNAPEWVNFPAGTTLSISENLDTSQEVATFGILDRDLSVRKYFFDFSLKS